MAIKRICSTLILASLILAGAGCGGPSKAEKEAATPVTLKVWRVFDDEDTLKPAMDAYRRIHPNVSFEYRILRFDEYEDKLIRAFALGEGPDVFSIHNTWIGEYKNLISPLPETLRIPYTEVKGTLKKEKITTVREEKTLTQRELRNDFVDTVPEDVILSYQPNPKKEPVTRIFGLPLAVDTLALFYNRDLLNAAGIAEPPKDWKEFQDQVKLLTRVNGADNSVLQSGAALGTGKNVERAADILSVLMMQNGTLMENRDRAVFAQETDAGTPGIDALRFYTDFANPVKEVYTWNASQPASFEAFASGKTAFFFGYSYHAPLVRAQAPRLNLGIAPLPQIVQDKTAKTVNLANYWVETVAKASKHTKWGWDFIQFATSKKQVGDYLATAGKPTARRSLINGQMENATIHPFASQLLTAKSWYRGRDAQVMEQAMEQMIDRVHTGTALEDAIAQAQSKVNQTY